jgi:hypothetical protein
MERESCDGVVSCDASEAADAPGPRQEVTTPEKECG